jgi:hypothetical protein
MEWAGYKMKNGYGLIRATTSSKDPQSLAHRVAWIVEHGEIPADKIVLHKCDNPACVNIEHLRLGSHKDNTADMVSKRRHGWRNGTAWQKLTVENYGEIKDLYAKNHTQQRIADKFKVSRSLVSMIVNGKLRLSGMER